MIKQVIHKTSVSEFPDVGAANVIYIADGEDYGKDYYWNGTGYDRMIGDIGSFPYVNDLYPTLETIQMAIDYLLSPELAVSLSITPSNIYGSGYNDMTFTWVMNKTVANIDTIVITANQTGYESYFAGLKELTVNYQGNLTEAMTFSRTVIFTIVITDTLGFTATSSKTVNYAASPLFAYVGYREVDQLDDPITEEIITGALVSVSIANQQELVSDLFQQATYPAKIILNHKARFDTLDDITIYEHWVCVPESFPTYVNYSQAEFPSIINPLTTFGDDYTVSTIDIGGLPYVLYSILSPAMDLTLLS